MKLNIIVIIYLFVSTQLIGCSVDTKMEGNTASGSVKVTPLKNNTPPVESLSKGKKVMSKWYTGKLIYMQLEGGFLAFTGENGERFLPINLDKKYQIDGAKVKILGYPDTNIMTIQMWGTPFKVIDVEVIEQSKSKVNQNLK